MDFFKYNKQILKGICLEFVNVVEKFNDIFIFGKDNLDYSLFFDDNIMKIKLGEIINKYVQKLYVKYFVIVGFDVGYMFFKDRM